MISFASVNGPSTTDVPPSAANTTLAPAALGLSPSPPSMIPALTSCSLYAFITANISSFGAIWASSAPSPLIMTRTFMASSFVVDAGPTLVPGRRLHHYVDRRGPFFDTPLPAASRSPAVVVAPLVGEGLVRPPRTVDSGAGGWPA